MTQVDVGVVAVLLGERPDPADEVERGREVGRPHGEVHALEQEAPRGSASDEAWRDSFSGMTRP